MENKIIEIVKADTNYNKCLLCCKNPAIVKLKINRLVNSDNVISFHVCNECLAQMQKEIEICE